jgi:predicted MFS family arabinose efflux permease
VLSELGDWAGRLALAVLVAEQTHSTLLTALVTTASVLPYIGIGQLLAAYANRFPRLRTIIIADLGRAVLFALLTIHMPVALILVLAFFAGCLTPPFEVSRNSLTVLTVPAERYGDAVALAAITFDSSVLFGYAVGGGLLAVTGARAALLLNACSFLLSATLLSGIAAAKRSPDPGPPVRVRDGWFALVDDPFIRRFFVGYLYVGACAVVGESLVALYALDVLHRQAGISGLLAAAIPAGAILATVLARTESDDTSKLRRASEIALIGSFIGIATFMAAPGIPLILLAFAAIGALNASRIPANEVTVLRLEDRMRAPTFAVLNGFLLGSQAIAAGLGGLVARSIGVRQTIVLSLAISGVVGLWGTLRPPHEIRHRIRSATTQS